MGIRQEDVCKQPRHFWWPPTREERRLPEVLFFTNSAYLKGLLLNFSTNQAMTLALGGSPKSCLPSLQMPGSSEKKHTKVPRRRIPSEGSQAKDPKRKFHVKDAKRKSQSESPKQKFTSERFQATDHKRIIPSESSQAKDPKRKFRKILVRSALVFEERAPAAQLQVAQQVGAEDVA